MERHFENDLRELKERILVMGGYAEKAIEEATNILILRDASRIHRVYEHERHIDMAHIDVDEACLRLIARQAPMGSDLRLLLAVIKINTDLERMGDQAVNIAQNGELYLAQPAIGDLQSLNLMASKVRGQVRKALDAFVRSDLVLANQVIRDDDEIDQMKNQHLKKFISVMQSSPNLIDAALDLILIARNLERLGDHATNIAEDVIFYISGEDIRHKRSREAAK